MKGTLEFKVGLFILACVAMVVGMSLHVNKDPSLSGHANDFDVILPDASGLVKNSNVKMAGIPVGIIKKIELDHGQARLKLALSGNIHLTKDAYVETKPNGILGDKYIELYPGSADQPELEPGSTITNAKESGSMDSVLKQVSKIAADVGQVAENLKKATSGEGDEKTPLGRIVLNLQNLTENLSDISDDKKDEIEDTIHKIHDVANSLNDFLNDNSDDGFKKNWKKAAASLGRIDSILKNVDEVAAKINHGQGTIGKLVNDEKTVDDINTAVENINSMLDKANQFQLDIDYHSEFQTDSMVKSYFGVNIRPGPDRYFLLQVIDDPKGAMNMVNTSTSTNGGPATTTSTQTVYVDQIKFSLQFAKSFYDLTVRAGLFESSGGAALDYYLFRKKLRLSMEAFDFGRPEGVDVRAYARYNFWSVFYAVAGGDDIFNKGTDSFAGTAASAFIGAGLDFTNDDLKFLLSHL